MDFGLFTTKLLLIFNNTLFGARLSRLRNGLLAALYVTLALVGGSCVKVQKEEEASGYKFEGIRRLEALPGGKWRLVWNPITALTTSNIRYLVYQKDEGKQWDLTSPVFRTKEHSLSTEDLRFIGSQCFLVRALVDGQYYDANEREICTRHTAFKFQGISSITPLDADGYVLNWRADGFSARELVFEIRRREKGSTNWTLLASSATNYFMVRDTPATPLDTSKNYCYKVNFIHERFKDDNNRELCSDSAIKFDGILSAEFVPPNSAKLKWVIEDSEVGKVSVFRIYRMQGRENRVLLDTVTNKFESGTQTFEYLLKGVALEARFDIQVKAVSRTVGLEDPNNNVIALYSQNKAPRAVVFDASADDSCKVLSELEKSGADARSVMGEEAYSGASKSCHIQIKATTKIDESGRSVPDKITCTAKFTDFDITQNRLRPRFAFKARLPGAERPVVQRKLEVGGFVDLDPVTRTGTAFSTYAVDAAVDKRGSDLFCELIVNDTIIDSDRYTSTVVFLPDTAPVATGIFISKRLRYINSVTGSSHYYDDPNGAPGAAGHLCLRQVAGQANFESNTDTNDVCEDTQLDILIKPAKVPESLLRAGNEADFQNFMKQIDFDKKGLGTDYSAFYGAAVNRYRVGYVDPDQGDKASTIQVRAPRNGRIPACGAAFNNAQTFSSPAPTGSPNEV